MVVLDVIWALFSIIFLIIGKLAFIWGPLLAMYLGIQMWHHFVTDRFVLGMTWTLFEIQPPRNVSKSPLGMELIFTNAMYHASIKGFWEIWIQGAPHFWFSLELAGTEGEVHYYIRCPSRTRDIVETQIYAQYPQAKVFEVEDYTLFLPFDAPNKDWYMWGFELKFLQPDAYPLRTYVDYGLSDLWEAHSSVAEQNKADPLTPTIEYLGSLKKGQHVWIQHIVRPSLKAYHSHHGGHHGWVDEARKVMADILEPYQLYKMREVGPNAGSLASEIRIPPSMNTRVERLNKKTEKLGFDVGTRIVCLGEAKYNTFDDFQQMRRASRLMFRPFNSPDGNSLTRHNSAQFDSPFSDPTGVALQALKQRMISWYRLRTFYHPPVWWTLNYGKVFENFFHTFKPHINVMNTEELATLYHFLGEASGAQNLKRVESRVAKPPFNLPV